MKLFSFHWQTYKLLYPLLFPIFYLIRQIMFDRLKRCNPFYHNNPFMLTSFMFISEAACGILEPFRKCQSKVKGSNNYTKKVSISHGKTKITEILEKAIAKMGNVIVEFLIIGIIAILDYAGFITIAFTNNLSNANYKIDKENITSCIEDDPQKEINETFFINDLSASMRMIEIIFISIFTAKLLGYPIYRHHIFSRLIQIIGIVFLVLFLFILTICQDNKKEDDFLTFGLAVLLYGGSFIVYSLKNIAIKWMIEKRAYSPFLLIFYVGVIGIGLMIVTFFITVNIGCSFAFCRDNYSKIWGTLTNESLIGIFYLVGTFIFGAVINLFQYLTNEYFNPCYIGIGDTLAGFLLWFNYCFFSNDYAKFGHHQGVFWTLQILSGIIYIISFFACLVYTENIICYFGKLNENVTSEIIKRGERDVDNCQIILSNEISLVEQQPDERVSDCRETENELEQ